MLQRGQRESQCHIHSTVLKELQNLVSLFWRVRGSITQQTRQLLTLQRQLQQGSLTQYLQQPLHLRVISQKVFESYVLSTYIQQVPLSSLHSIVVLWSFYSTKCPDLWVCPSFLLGHIFQLTSLCQEGRKRWYQFVSHCVLRQVLPYIKLSQNTVSKQTIAFF